MPNYIYFSVYSAICRGGWGRILIIVTEGVGCAGRDVNGDLVLLTM
jgi:hypothetical protein